LIPTSPRNRVTAPITTADQLQTNPDPFNQLTVDELGWMLQSIYQCAKDGSGALINAFGMAYNQRECQQMLYLMSGNSIGALLEMECQSPFKLRTNTVGSTILTGMPA
jgi:hypothetical protein